MEPATGIRGMCAKEVRGREATKGILVLFQVPVIKYCNRSNLGEKMFVLGQFQVITHHSRKATAVRAGENEHIMATIS